MPPFSDYWENTKYNGEEFVRDYWVPLFEKGGVDMVISGHTHIYQRGKRNGVIYTTIGGAGGELDRLRVADWLFFEKVVIQHHFAILQFNDCFLYWTAYNLENEIIDSLSLSSLTPLPSLCL